MSQLTLNEAGTAATVAVGGLATSVTTILNPNIGLTGTDKYVQLAVAAAVGMLVQNVRVGRGYNFWTVA